jgi:hypothetical protein
MGQRLARIRDWFLVPLLEKPVQVFENPTQLRDRGSHGRLRTYPDVADALLQAVEVTPGEVELIRQGLWRGRGTQSLRAFEEQPQAQQLTLQLADIPEDRLIRVSSSMMHGRVFASEEIHSAKKYEHICTPEGDNPIGELPPPSAVCTDGHCLCPGHGSVLSF